MPVKEAYAQWMTQNEFDKATQVASHLNLHLEKLDTNGDRFLIRIGYPESNLSEFWKRLRGHLH